MKLSLVKVWTAWLTCVGLCAWELRAEEPNDAEPPRHQVEACDRFAPPPAEEEAAQRMLQGLSWDPRSFPVTWYEVSNRDYQAVVRFPSPHPIGDPVNDEVALWWYRTREPGQRPAVVVVHESGAAMPVGQMFAKALRDRGLQTFLIQLPYYGMRRGAMRPQREEQFVALMRQGIADVRRARDAVAVLPDIDPASVHLQGTSLGGFVAAVVAGLDENYQKIFIMLAGGDLASLLEHGQRESAELRRRLEAAGYTGDRLQQIIAMIEPNHLAPRMPAERVWLYTALQDEVVPLQNAMSLRQRARLTDDHHIRMPGGHVTCVVFFPIIVDHVVHQITGEPLRFELPRTP
ncbi:MAG: hypothetical protein KatS3mg114_1041 [Planctomycetaceae bacterium]|nr:MAG: hypothetical protein KatS3mg114_1041 [Planctomycetaceae bacterium]